MLRACARDYDRTMWLVSPSISDEHRFEYKRISLACDSDALIQPNPLWAAWALNAVMDEYFGNHKKSSLNHVFNVDVYSKLIESAMVSAFLFSK